VGKRKPKVPYDERSDDEKLESNWKKAKAQFDRKDWSASVLRAATAVEISANIYIRRFLIDGYSLPNTFVDALLLSANGIDGKFKRLVKPAAEFEGTWKEISKVQKKIEGINKQRNGVAHAGKFKNKSDAKAVFLNALEAIRALAPNEAKKLGLPFES
jgi:hypothetical protein